MAELGQQEGHAVAAITGRWLRHGQIVSLVNDFFIRTIQTLACESSSGISFMV